MWKAVVEGQGKKVRKLGGGGGCGNVRESGAFLAQAL